MAPVVTTCGPSWSNGSVMEEEQEGDGDMQQNATPVLDLSLARSKNSAGQLAPPRKTERLPSARGRHPILARGYQDDGTWAERSPGHRFIQAVRDGVNTKSAATYAGVARRTVYGWLGKGRRLGDKEHPTKEEQMYRDFLHQVERAEASFLAELVRLWRQAAKTDWRAAVTCSPGGGRSAGLTSLGESSRGHRGGGGQGGSRSPRPQDPRQREARELPLRAFDLLAVDAPVIDKEEVPDGN